MYIGVKTDAYRRRKNFSGGFSILKRGIAKRTIAGLLMMSLTAGTFYFTPFRVSADKISDLQGQSQSIQSDIDSTNSELVDLMASIQDLQKQIDENEQDISDTNTEIEEATKAVDKLRGEISSRMKYTYESDNNTGNLFTIMAESGSIADFISRVEYASKIYQYDKEQVETYDATVKELSDMKKELKNEEASLNTQKSTLSVKQESLNKKISDLKAQKGNVDAELEQAKQEAARKAEEERKAREAAQKAAAEKAAAEAARNALKQQNIIKGNVGGRDNGGGSDSNTTTNADAGKNLNPSGSANGSAIVAYAKQFVGNHYAWGGNNPNVSDWSSSDGIDCSGFVHYVLSHFGISSPRYSQSFLDYGKPVSPENMQAGDVVVYPGHVAIFAGGGVIVEAQSTRAGITCNRSVYCHTILGIRRF
jgi:peptidoglycan hydrolase CwlO-like protein